MGFLSGVEGGLLLAETLKVINIKLSRTLKQTLQWERQTKPSSPPHPSDINLILCGWGLWDDIGVGGMMGSPQRFQLQCWPIACLLAVEGDASGSTAMAFMKLSRIYGL